MNFKCSLRPPSSGFRGDFSKRFLEQLDYESLVMEMCALLSETDSHFSVGGFGQDDWHLSVAYDLSAVIEQLPALLNDLRTGADAELDFYAQGIERSLSFGRSGQGVVIVCHSRTSWVPDPDTEVVSFDDLEYMLVRLAKDFASSLELTSAGLSEISPFQNWRVGNV